MTWDAHHRRAEVLRAVEAEADRRRDGRLPADLPGVAETFADPTDLVGALQLRWHTRLSGSVDRALLDHPGEPAAGVVAGWRAAAEDLPGLRLVLDGQCDDPITPDVAAALDVARRKEWALLAALAGLASAQDAAAAGLGRRLEEQARRGVELRSLPGRHRAPVGHGSLWERVRGHLTAA